MKGAMKKELEEKRCVCVREREREIKREREIERVRERERETERETERVNFWNVFQDVCQNMAVFRISLYLGNPCFCRVKLI